MAEKPGLARQPSSRHASLDADGNEVVRVGCFSRNVVKCPCVIMWIVFVLAFVVGVAPIQLKLVKVDPSMFAGFDTNTIPQQAEYFTWERGLKVDDNVFSLTGGGLSSGGSSSSGGGRSSGGPGGADDDEDNLDPKDMTTFFIYESLASEGILSAEGVAAMATVEGSLFTAPVYDANCKKTANALNASRLACSPPTTLLNLLYKNDALQQTQCLDGWCSALQYGVPFAGLAAYCTSSGNAWGTFPCTSTIYDWRDGTLAPEAEWPTLMHERLCGLSGSGAAWAGATMSLMMPTAAECTASTLSATFARSMYTMTTAYNQTVEQFYDANEVAVKAVVEAMNDAQNSVSASSATTSVSASKPKGGKAVNVMWGPKVGWTDPTGRVFFKYLFGDMALAGYSIILVLIVLLCDTQSILLTLAGFYEIIFSLPLAMFGWMLIGQKNVSTMELLGVFLILCIGADDIFVFTDTWKESQYLPPSISGSVETRFAWSYRRAASAMLTTTATTCITLVLNAASPFPLIKSFGIFNMFVVLFDYILVISWYATTVVALTKINQKCCPPGKNWEWSCCCPGVEGDHAPKSRRSTRWMRDTLAPCLHKLRVVLPIVTVGILAGGLVIVANNFQEGEQQFFPAQHPVTLFGTIQADYFAQVDDWKYTNVVMYGLDPETPLELPKSNDFFKNMADDYVDRHVPQYSTSFSFGPSEQEAIVAQCDALSADASLVPAGEHYCLLNELKAFAPSAFPYASEAALVSALTSFYASSAYAQLGASFRGYASKTGFVTDGGSGIAALWHSFNTTIDNTINRGIPSQSRPYYNAWTAAVDAQCTSAVPCVLTNREGLFSSMATLAEMRNSAILNMFLALVVAYVVLVITTHNVLVPLLALLSIASTIIWSLAVVFMAGYQFNANAAILSVMAVGLAVDYAVHIVHFYNEAAGTRYEKSAAALHGVGISIVGGAITTGGASVPLMFALNFVFFQMAGWFIFFTAFFGFFFTFFQLTPLLMLVGPTGETGDLAVIWRCITGKKADVKTSATAGVIATPKTNETL